MIKIGCKALIDCIDMQNVSFYIWAYFIATLLEVSGRDQDLVGTKAFYFNIEES